jgi:hypothetical protein
MPHTPYHEMRERYQQNAVAMSHAMREAGEHIQANSQLDLTPDELVEAIDLIATMLLTARYHADRMRVYDRLMSGGLRNANRDG